MNRYIVVNTKAKNSAVWETIGANYTPSKGEVCIIVPPTSEITKDEAAVRTSLIEQHYFTQAEKLALIALINNEEVLTEEQKKFNTWSILFQNEAQIKNKITHFNENGLTVTIPSDNETTTSKYISSLTADEQIYLNYKLNNKINNFTKQFALHNFEGTILTVEIDSTNSNFTYITLAEHPNVKFKVVSNEFKYKKKNKIRLIPSIDSITSMSLIGKETWKIKNNAPVDEASLTLITTNIPFTTNNQKATSIGITNNGVSYVLVYGTIGEVAGRDPGLDSAFVWDNEAYKTLEFDTVPTGVLLNWLQNNADKITPSINIEESELLPSNYIINSAIQSNKEILLDKLELVPAQEDFNTDSNVSQIHYCVSKSVLFNDPKADGNIIISTENIDYTGVAPISIKIGDGTTLFRDLPTLTAGNVQGDWTAIDPTNPSYIKNKPILNDDLFYQSKEKTLLIPSSSLYDNEKQILVTGLLDLFNITYPKPDIQKTNALTPAEKQALIYIVNAGSYDLKDKTNTNTQIFTNNDTGKTNRDTVINKLQNYYQAETNDVQLIAKNFVYLTDLINEGNSIIEPIDKELLLVELTKIITTDKITDDVIITVKDKGKLKTFNNDQYIKISNNYFHPNDLLIYNDNNWGYYEIHMYGATAPFYDNEIKYLNYLIDNGLDRNTYLQYTEVLQQLLKIKINNYIIEGKYKNYIINKLNFIVPNASKNEGTINKLITLLNNAIENYNKTAETPKDILDIEKASFEEKIDFLVNYINNKIAITEDLPNEDKTSLKQIIQNNNSVSLEINKQPRYWFYKSNILKTKEKQTLNKIIKDTLYVYNNRFNLEEQSILIAFIEGKAPTDEQYLKLKQGLKTELSNKVRLNSDITVFNGKNFLIERLSLEKKLDKNGNIYYDYNLTDDDRLQLLKQVQISKNNLMNQLNEIEMQDITEEILEELIETLSLNKDNTIIEGFNGENVYYEINNEMIFDSKDRAIYIRLANLIGYLKQTKNLEIIFHYKTRSLNTTFLSDLVSNWDENDPEQPGYIANRIVYKNNDQTIGYELWFYNWLQSVIDKRIDYYLTKKYNILQRITDLENAIKIINKKIGDIEEEIKNINKNNQDAYLLNRISTLIVSQPDKPVLSDKFFPKIWICTNNESGYGLVYWRSGGENSEGKYSEAELSNVKWTPISAIWSPDILNN